jgi:hypothetical protein
LIPHFQVALRLGDCTYLLKGVAGVGTKGSAVFEAYPLLDAADADAADDDANVFALKVCVHETQAPRLFNGCAASPILRACGVREWTWWAHMGGGNALAFKQPTWPYDIESGPGGLTREVETPLPSNSPHGHMILRVDLVGSRGALPRATQVETPAAPWEFVAMHRLASRLPEAAQPMFLHAHRLHLFDDCTLLLADFGEQGTLADALDKYAKAGR